MSLNFALVLALFNMSSMRAGRVLLVLYALDLGASASTVGLLAATAVNPSVAHQGLLLGGGLGQVGRQLLGVLAASAFAFASIFSR